MIMNKAKRSAVIAGNWKMNKTATEAAEDVYKRQRQTLARYPLVRVSNRPASTSLAAPRPTTAAVRMSSLRLMSARQAAISSPGSSRTAQAS